MIRVAYPRIADRLRDIRMTQPELAHGVGVTPITMSHYMTGRTTPTLDTCRAICRETGCTMHDFMMEATNED